MAGGTERGRAWGGSKSQCCGIASCKEHVMMVLKSGHKPPGHGANCAKPKVRGGVQKRTEQEGERGQNERSNLQVDVPTYTGTLNVHLGEWVP